ncbi:MAG: hypothetical protein RLZ25_1648 [Pseudomonadota bacterium]|jgi:predicted acylesterase/phospholipase RssA
MRIETALFSGLLIVLGILNSGCSLPGRLPAVPQGLTSKAEIAGLPGVRYVIASGDMPELTQEGIESVLREKALRKDQGLPTDPLPKASFLALSGGGDDGAFGAGLLNGWTRAGTRPVFKLVTGISTGALLAPFAFIGPDQDVTLTRVYTQSTPKDILEERSFLSAISDDALADNAPLGRLLERYVTQDLLKAIAREYAKGRLLLIATTNLDSRQAVIWNMTRIAASGHPKALPLFRQIMLASAAIPGAFPPAMIDVAVEGRPYQEMHVDGGAMAQVFLYPPAFKLGELGRTMGLERERELFLIRNSRLDAEWSEVQRQTLSIAGRAISSLIQTQGAGDLYRIYAIAQRDNVSYHLAYIPESFKAVHREEFDPSYMKALYQRGFDMAIKGYPWKSKPPDL